MFILQEVAGRSLRRTRVEDGAGAAVFTNTISPNGAESQTRYNYLVSIFVVISSTKCFVEEENMLYEIIYMGKITLLN